MEPISRRRMLGIAAGTVFLVACGSPKKKESNTGDPTPEPTPDNLSVALATIELAVGDQRLAFALFDGEVPFAPAGTQVSLIPPAGEAIVLEPSTETVEMGAGGDSPATKVNEVFVLNHDFKEPGFWTLEAKFTDDSGERTAVTTMNVLADSESPMVGEPAVQVETATFDKPLGVDPICTRDPACSMHQMTITEAVTSGKPSVIAFATPKFCTSRTCGPTIDIIEGIVESFEEVNFVHIEVWKDENVSDLAPGMEEWGIPGEPWVVFVDAQGIVRARWSGALGPTELSAAVTELANGRL